MAATNWYNSNEGRSFPFLARLTGNPVTGTPTLDNLPLETIVDFGCIMGPLSEYVAGDDEVYLHSISRNGGTFRFEFRSTADGLFGVPLLFTRFVSDRRYLTEYSNDNEVGNGDLSDGSGSEAPEDGFVRLTEVDFQTASESISDSIGVNDTSISCTDAPLWTGYLVTGDLAPLVNMLDDGMTLLAVSPATIIIEQGLVQSLVGTYVRSINLANEDRTRSTYAEGCGSVEWPVPVGDLLVRRRCIQGDVRFKEGFNNTIRQLAATNTLEFSAEVAGGAGQPCGEVQLSEREEPPTGSSYLSGGPGCNDVLRSINASGGPRLHVFAGHGVGLTPVPEDYKLIIDVDMRGMSTCFIEESENP